MFQLQSVTQTWRKRGTEVAALTDLDLQIDNGEFVAVVGPSGSGKTTLLSVLGGMLSPTNGTVLLDGQSLYELTVEQRTLLRRTRIGFVFQSFNLVPWLTARENVQIPLMLIGKTASQQCERANELLSRVGLAERAEHRPAEMSQGQQQRVALARTLANEPDIILADEPTGNLDEETRDQVMQYLTEFHVDGRSIVMVTHDKEAARYANRTIRLVDGVQQHSSLVEAA